MAHLTNRNVIIKNLPKFDDWFHVIFDPLVMKVYNENDVHKKGESKDELQNNLHPTFGMTLTYNPNSLTLSRNQINVLILAMLNVLHFLDAKICQISFFGLK